MDTTTSTQPPVRSVPKYHRMRKFFRKLILAVVVAGSLTLLLMGLVGVFRSKVATQPEVSSGRSARGLLVKVRLVSLPRYETAVGTVPPVDETAVASKLLAKVVEVHVKAGQAVSRGDVLGESRGSGLVFCFSLDGNRTFGAADGDSAVDAGGAVGNLKRNRGSGIGLGETIAGTLQWNGVSKPSLGKGVPAMARHLTIQERDRIAQLFSQGYEQKEIARSIGRSHATVFGELRRNGTEQGCFTGQPQQ